MKEKRSHRKRGKRKKDQRLVELAKKMERPVILAPGGLSGADMHQVSF